MDHPPQLPPPPAARRPRRTLVLALAAGALLLTGVLATAMIASSVTAGGPDADAAEPASLDTLFEPVVAEERQAGQAGQAGQAAPADKPGRHGRRHHGPLRLREGEKVLAGAVTSVADGKLTVRKDNGAEVTVTTDADTRVRGNDNKALTDLQAGERVIVKAGSDGTTDVVLAVRAHATGTVTKLEGDRATVMSPGGLTHELDLSGVPQRPAVGTVVIAAGTATDGGATLKVEQLRELPTLG